MRVTFLILFALMAKEKRDTVLLKYKVEERKGIFKIERPESEERFPLEDILGKKVYTKGIAASRFGGEKAILLEREGLIKRVQPPPSILRELPPGAARRAEEVRREVLISREGVRVEKLRPGQVEREVERVEEAVPVTLRVEEREREAMKLAAIKAAGEMKVEGVIFYLKERLEEDRPEIRRAAAEALASMGEQVGVEALHAALKEEEVSARVEVIRAVGRVGLVTSIEPLMRLLGSEETEVSREAAFALAKMGDERGITVLYKLLKSNDPVERFEVAVALADAGDAAGVDELKRRLGDDNDEIRLKAVKALGIVGDKSIVPLLEVMMKKDKDFRVRIAASESILKIR